MDGLPFEIGCRICEYIHDTHRPSLFALALASKNSHSAACASIFRDIHITVSSRAKLARDVVRLASTLERNEAWKYVRRLELDGNMPALKDDGGSLSSPEWTLNNATWYGTDEIYGKTDDLTMFGGDGHPPRVEDDCWAPLARLIDSIPYLADLAYDCPSQFPPRLLHAIHSRPRHCRLHLPKFRFRSLRKPETDPHELAIATSPCLHAISVQFTWRDSSGLDNYSEDAALRTVAGLAPKLKKVRMVHGYPASSAALYSSRDRPREPWKGFVPDAFPHKVAALDQLSLCGHGQILPTTLEEWSRHTDMSNLRTLALSEGVGASGLHWLATQCSFPRLCSLELRMVDGRATSLNPAGATDLTVYAIWFLASIPALEDLELSGCFEPAVLDAVLEHHGRTLVRLVMAPTGTDIQGSTLKRTQLTLGVVRQMRASCTALTDLTMPVRRTRGQPPETTIYKALGMFPRLHTLFLTLDASNPAFDGGISAMGRDAPDDSTFDNFERQFYDSMHRSRNGHVRMNFINCAVDETLARSIWDAIADDKVGFPLRSLKLTTTGGLQCGVAGFSFPLMNIMQHLSRSYQLTGSVRDDSGEVEVCELGKRAREARDKQEREKTVKQAESPEIVILRSIWPANGEDSDWREEWSSWPLQYD
ncbi:hypothetical protein LTR85_005965 [Meristemomyces frigidus]|nr:hypothetical protein LTR85_005965 [Meristemomyces frigidus]